ncbi:MAG: hypothetical protein HRU19_19895 [Pseudobacteriovorax sp.]|nr:hypothetical protein [Pseudobacteriovorax sp.]
MKLSKNFTLAEFTHSDLAKRRRINNTPGKRQIEAMRYLAQFVLQPIRDEFGPTKITSGYRSPELNLAVGSTKESQHIRGEPADFYCKNAPSETVLAWIINQSNIPFDMIVDEIDVKGVIHITYKHNRRSVLLQTDKNRSYINHPNYNAPPLKSSMGDLALVDTPLLNLRDSAGGKIITTLNQGTVVEKLGSEGDWDEVKVHGFLHSRYIKS